MAAIEMGSIFEFFGKEVADINNARNVSDPDNTRLVGFVNTVFMEIPLFCSIGFDRSHPINSGFVVVEYCDCLFGIIEVKVNRVMFDARYIVEAFKCHVDFCDAGATCSLLLSNSFHAMGPPTQHIT
jgi:hypothetical protein